MGDLSRRESREAFRDFIWQNVPEHLRTRTWQMLESIVFSQHPILRELEYLEVRDGSGAPTVSEYPSDGFGMWLDNNTDTIYVVLKWKDEFYNLGGSGSAGGEINTASNLGAGVGTYEQKVSRDLQFNSLVSQNGYLTIGHDAVNHEIDFTLNFSALEGDISHLNIDDIGAYTHITIDNHIDDGTIHFTIGDLDLGDYVLRDGTTPMTADWDFGAFDLTNIDEVQINDKLTVTGPGTPVAPALALDNCYVRAYHLGLNRDPTATHIFIAAEQYTGTGPHVGMGFFPELTPGGPATSSLWALQGNAWFGGSWWGVNSLVGALQFFPAPTVTFAPHGSIFLDIIGVATAGILNVAGQPVTARDIRGISVQPIGNIFGGTDQTNCDTATGVDCLSATATLGTWGVLTGIRIGAQTSGVINRGLWMAGDGIGADVVFGLGADARMHYDGVDLQLDTSLVIPSDFLLQCGTDKTLELLETVWDDLRVPGFGVGTGANAPTKGNFLGAGGLQILRFIGTGVQQEEIYFVCQLPHGYKQGTDIFPHVHWTPTDANAGNVVWQLEYSWANIQAVFPATTTITVTDSTQSTAWVHLVASFAAITGTGKNLSSMLVCHMFRDPAHGSDTYGFDAAFLEIDFHIELNTLGSRQEFVK